MRVFPRSGPFPHLYFNFWLVHFVMKVISDWLNEGSWQSLEADILVPHTTVNPSRKHYVTHTQTHITHARTRMLITHDTLRANIYWEKAELWWRQLTGSEGPTNSLNVTGASGALISMAKHGPQHSSSTILWKKSKKNQTNQDQKKSALCNNLDPPRTWENRTYW